MLHFRSSTASHGASDPSRKSDTVNALQHKCLSDSLLLRVQDDLHDARRVHSHGQEEDLRSALSMLIERVTELTSHLGEAYKTQADLEVQLNVAKSNLQLVIANNEMLEEALRQENSIQAKEVGWRRASSRSASTDRSLSIEIRASTDEAPVTETSDTPTLSSRPPPLPPSYAAPPACDNRFFRFRFGSSSSSSRCTSQPGTPALTGSPLPNGLSHLTSPSMPTLPLHANKELADLTEQLEKERAARKSVAEEKACFEAELESLSQALFEEANRMVATERKRRVETEEELNELRREKEALRCALQVIECENLHLRNTYPGSPDPG